MLRFAAIAAQFAILVSAFRSFQLESEYARQVLKVAWFGFLAHHFLPRALQLPFFAALSVASVLLILPPMDGLAVLLAGGVLIGLVHLPIPFRFRLILVAVVGLAFLALRMEWIPVPLPGPLTARIWPILGAMFMFRLIVYLYDLKHAGAPFSASRAIAYFFMIPNVGFPLMPVVDYKTFCRTHFNDDRYRIYQVGLIWIGRGLVHLLLFKIVYHFFTIDPAHATNIGEVAQYSLTAFMFYLRVSGTFHIIVGLLHLFGFNLPQTHHLYFLSSSFTDFWRRINIYWKDLMMKVVFYPTYFRTRRLGDVKATAIATSVTFAVTWFLHSYQWLWLRGRFPIKWQDILFWSILGLVVSINLRYETTRERERPIAKSGRELRSSVMRALSTAGTFAVICVLWTVWSTPTAEIENLLAASGRVTISGITGIVVVLLGIGVAGALLGHELKEDTEGSRRSGASGEGYPFWRQVAVGFALATALVVVAKRPGLLLHPPLVAAIATIETEPLNRIEKLGREQAYYQGLGDVFVLNTQIGTLEEVAPAGWHNTSAKRLLDEFQRWDWAPSVRSTFKGAEFSTNRWGMRDHEYSREKPPGTLRIALLGASQVVGAGVPMERNFENLFEARLNREAPLSRFPRYEVLNFAVDGYAPYQKLTMLERRVLDFDPDIVIYMANANELDWANRPIDDVVTDGVPIPFDRLRATLQAAGVERGQARPEIHRRLAPHREKLLGQIFARLREVTDLHGVHAIVGLLSKANDRVRPRESDVVSRLARAEGLPQFDLWGAFDHVHRRESMHLRPWDTHPNRAAHEILAGKLYHEFVESGMLAEIASSDR